MTLPLRRLCLAALAASLFAACAHDPSDLSGITPEKMECPYADAKDGTQSYDLLCREPVANRTSVKHILIGWKGLTAPGQARPEERSYEEAQALARELLQKLRDGAAIEPLMAQYSDDPGSAASGSAYEVTPSASLVPEFKALGLRLNVGEAGIVKSQFGLHVIQRVK